MRRKSLAMVLSLVLACDLVGGVQAASECAGCDEIRQYWANLQSGSHLVGTVTAADVTAGTLPGATALTTDAWFLLVPAV